MRFFRDTRGNIATTFALASIPLVASAGVAVEMVKSGDLRTELAAALDGAVLAGVAAETKHTDEAETFFDKNFHAKNVTKIARSFKKTGNITLEGTATAELESSLLRVIGINSYSVSVNSTAVRDANAGTGNDPKLCILALSPNASQSLLANSGANVNAASCEIHVKSTANPAAIFNAGTTITSAKTCIEGRRIIDNGGSHPNLHLGCKTLDDPYAGKVPAPASTACTYNDSTYSGNTTLRPGVYCGWHNFNSGTNVTLQPGTYVIRNGGWNANGGTWTGSDITFYFADTSKIQFNSAVKATLSAPSSGPYAGFLFAEKSGLSNSHFIFDDNKGFDMTGIIYLPSRDVYFNSSTKVETRKITAVMNTVIFNGVTWNLVHYDNGNNSGSGSDVAIRLVK